MTDTAVPVTTRKDWSSDQEPRWCPGCGDYTILAAVQSLMPELGVRREETVFVSGIGCAARFPYYMDTYGIHTIHGRAPAIATGLAVSRPDLDIWVVGGDGDMLSIGGNHLIHALRRNVNLTILMFNNQIYGLTKGQFSPTSEFGKKTKTTPLGSIDHPFSPISVAIAAGATFAARTVDSDLEHLGGVLKQAALHKGTAFVEIYQNCITFNDGAYDLLTDRATREEVQLRLEHGKPLVFGKGRDKGIRFRGAVPEVVTLGQDGVTEAELQVHDAHAESTGAAYLLSLLAAPAFPVPMGVFRSVAAPTYEALDEELRAAARAKSGRGRLEQLLGSGTTWTIE